MFTVLSLTMCRSMAKGRHELVLFAIMGAYGHPAGAFGSVFTTYSSLYLPKDNDQMLSLPIPVDTLIAARLLGVYLSWASSYSGVGGAASHHRLLGDGVRRPACWRAFCSCC